MIKRNIIISKIIKLLVNFQVKNKIAKHIGKVIEYH